MSAEATPAPASRGKIVPRRSNSVRYGPYVHAESDNIVVSNSIKGLEFQNVEHGSTAGGWRVHRPLSRPERIIIDFFPMDLCGPGIGFSEKDSATVPAALADHGITQAVWLDWVDKLKKQVLPNAPCCGGCGCLLSCLLPCYWCAQNGSYQDLMRGWLVAFNQDVLIPKGLFASIQTAVYDDNNIGKYTHDEELSWLAIATNPQEIEALKQEVAIWRFHPGCPSCIGCGCPHEAHVTPEAWCCQKTMCCCGVTRVF